MAQIAKPEIAPLVIGLTRPRMMWGVPIGLFVGELMLVVMIFLNTKNLGAFLLLLPFHAVAFMMTIRDLHMATICRVRIAKCPLTRNRHFWGGNSYQP